ncbi:MAG: hypothetical protein KBH78_01545 [Candidatus Hydrogenedentes bacterium]|nr:hypothetical protein [Candidatus Hydrogenedentota bacterium]
MRRVDIVNLITGGVFSGTTRVERSASLAGAGILLVLLAGGLAVTPKACARGGIEPWPENPWYWSYHGKPVLLLGGSDDDNLFQWPEADLKAQLDRLVASGGNVIRNTMSDRKDKGFEVYPFRQLDEGKYDLDAWNPEYWDRFERMLRETARRRVFVQIEVWDRFDYTDAGGSDRWWNHPYNPRNNVNYTFEASGFAERYPDHPGANRQPFFFTVPELENNQVVLKYQQAFVRRMLSYTLKYDHVLYCVDNETSGAEAWAQYWARFIHEQARAAGKTVYVTEMWDEWDITHATHRRTYDHPELYGYVDVSQNNHVKGWTHWERLLAARSYLAFHPRPMNNTKIYGADGNRFGDTTQDGIERFWRILLAGCASARFHRPDSGLGLNDVAVASLRAARKVESMIPFWKLAPPADQPLSRDRGLAWLSVAPGDGAVIFVPRQDPMPEIWLDAHLVSSKEPSVLWIDVEKATWGKPEPLERDAEKFRLGCPGSGNWIGVIQ